MSEDAHKSDNQKLAQAQDVGLLLDAYRREVLGVDYSYNSFPAAVRECIAEDLAVAKKIFENTFFS